MLRTDINWPDHRQYKSGSDFEPLEFFSECLRNSNRFDFYLGFFSSSAIRLLSCSFASFLYRGGKMRLIINNILSDDDKRAVENGENKLVEECFDLSDLKKLQETLSKRDKHFFECLSWLIAKDCIEIKVIRPKNGIGISHSKEGIFYDDSDSVAFNGSCNFSHNAIINNRETIDANCSWDLGTAISKISNTQEIFELAFSGKDDTIEYLSADKIVSDIKDVFGSEPKEIVELLQQESEIILAEADGNVKYNYRIEKILKKAQSELQELVQETWNNISTPHFPYPSGPREYQQFACERWKKNEQKGLFAMATGTGKTITALNCLLEIYNNFGYYKAIILVPTLTLVKQWESECERFKFSNIILASSRNPTWKDSVSALLTQEKLDNKFSYIIISTYASYTKEYFLAVTSRLSKKVLFIADEAHNIGAPKMLDNLPHNFSRRIGLSATPNRQFDDKANTVIKEFFNSEDQYTFEYSMEEAIDKNVLCHYYYYPHLVQLNSDEMSRYEVISKQIAKYYHEDTDSFTSDPILTSLLLKRKRIIHKAHEKLEVFKTIVEDEFQRRGNLKYTMVYVPEGKCPSDYYEDYTYEKIEEDIEDIEDLNLINSYTAAVRDITGVTVSQFTADVENREQILSDFSKGDIQVLTSMKCLDEGVDVPRAELAIFCASTGNPRQFIQRRGRILRTCKEKSFAYIHDLVVIPLLDVSQDTYKMERNMLKRELMRVKDFSLLANNSSDTIDVLEDVLTYYELNLYNNN